MAHIEGNPDGANRAKVIFGSAFNLGAQSGSKLRFRVGRVIRFARRAFKI